MIDISSEEKRKGIISALELIVKAKQGGIYVEEGDDSDNKLKLPNNIDIHKVNDDPEYNSEVYDDQTMSPEAKVQRLERRKELNSEEQIQRDAEEIIVNTQRKRLEAEKAKKAAEERIKSLNKVSSFDVFKDDLANAVAAQESSNKITKRSFSHVNQQAANTGLIRKGRYRDYEDTPVPVFNVLVDRSGSMSGGKMAKTERALKALYDEQDEGKLIINEYWFGTVFGKKGASVGGSTNEWCIGAFVDACINDHAENIIIFTDDDLDDLTLGGYLRSDWRHKDTPVSYPPKQLIVPGVVYFVWLNGRGAPGLKQIIRSDDRENQREYSLY